MEEHTQGEYEEVDRLDRLQTETTGSFSDMFVLF